MSSDASSADETTPRERSREVFSVYLSVSGRAETFAGPREAGRAFFLADPEERPSVMHLIGNSARTMARTEIHGAHPGGEPRYFKSLPSSHAPDAVFRAGFLEAMETSLVERLGRIAAVKEPAHADRVDTRLLDDLESFAYRASAKAAQLWAGHSTDLPFGPVLKAAVGAYAAGLSHDAAAGRTEEGEISGDGLRQSENVHDPGGPKVTRHSTDRER